MSTRHIYQLHDCHRSKFTCFPQFPLPPFPWSLAALNSVQQLQLVIWKITSYESGSAGLDTKLAKLET